MDKIRIYKILIDKFNESETEEIMNYVESSKKCVTASELDLILRIQKLESDLKIQYIKLDKRIIVGLVVVTGITLLLMRILYVVLAK
ncbi:MAG: hypothetical protein NT178_16600 [Proteobacteria bacterium]|nr:hypothetical protein [Pseudomonadota bacterium]